MTGEKEKITREALKMYQILSYLLKNSHGSAIAFAQIKNNPYFCKRINRKQTIHL